MVIKNILKSPHPTNKVTKGALVQTVISPTVVVETLHLYQLETTGAPLGNLVSRMEWIYNIFYYHLSGLRG
jgi:hypothetical protein